MIVLDTHIWVWWVSADARLTAAQASRIDQGSEGGIGISAISCWEVAKLVELGRLALRIPVLEWLETALQYPGCRLVELSPRIAVESTVLPPTFHRDPADQIVVATARILDCPLVTADERILAYPHVKAIPG